mgnify:CR=1 FL=1
MDWLTSALEAAALVLFVVALVVFVWPWSVAGALASGGVLLLAASFLLTRRATR